MEENYSDRRIDKRMKSELKAEYKLFGEDINLLSFQYAKATTKDISKRGVCIEIGKTVKEGDVMRLDVAIDERQKINTFGEVEWCRKDKDSYLAGISFISLSYQDTETLKNYLSLLN